jgi:DNA-binding LacI/PurR family transcriptional regulator
MDVRRLARMVKKTEADAWVVVAGTSEVLQWFMQQKIPAFALYGRRHQLKIAGIGPDPVPALIEATRRMIDLGHQRIVFLDSLFNISEPGITGSAFLDELSAAGITTGSYNMPDWQGGSKVCMSALTRRFKSPRQRRSSPAPVPSISQRHIFSSNEASGCRKIFP